MTNPTPSPAPAAREMAQQRSVDPCPGVPRGTHHPECGSGYPEPGCHPDCPTLRRCKAVLADTYRPTEHDRRSPAPEPERAGADAMREALREALEEAGVVMETAARALEYPTTPHDVADARERLWSGHCRLRAALAREVPRG